MQLGMIGLGRMGSNMARRLHKAGHECIGYDVNADAISELAADGVAAASSLNDMVDELDAPRHVWIMVPAAFVGSTIDQLAPLLAPGDTIIDGGNSFYRHDIDRAEALADQELRYVDVGVSGGVWGLERGYSMMIGGAEAAVDGLAPIFDALAPGVELAPRTPGRAGRPAPEERGWLHCGPPGSGHFVKMVHNGIEYGMMASLAEGLNVLANADVGAEDHADDAETAPLEDAKYFQFDFDLAKITEVWRRGSVISSWLVDLTAQALLDDPRFEKYEGRVSDSGEGRWTVDAAVEEGVPVPVLAASLFQRFSSRGRADTADKALSAMRAGFGGHIEQKESSR